MRALHDALHAMLTRGKVANSSIAGRTLVQATGLDNETFSDVELAMPPGLVGRPKPGADVLILDIGGYSSHKLLLAGDHTADTVPGLQPGEYGLANGAQSLILHLDHTTLTAAILYWAANASAEQMRLVTEAFVPFFNAHTHAHGAPPDVPMTAAQLTGGA